MTTFVLRDYQEDTIAGVNRELENGHRRVAVVLPTGGGKTVVFAHLAEQYCRENPGKRVLVLAHRDELIDQAHRKLRATAPDLRIGIVKAARNQVQSRVIVASVQTLRHAKRRERLRNVGLIIVDECHHALLTNSYGTILEHFGCFSDDGAVAVGVTATLVRSDSGNLADVWQVVAYRRDVIPMIRDGYLRDVIGKRVEIPDLDLTQVRKSKGDFRDGDLGEALAESMAPELVAKAYLEHASDRSGIVFTPTVDFAYVINDAMRAAGIASEVLHADHAVRGKVDRKGILGRLESGETQVVVNVGVLTEGFDCPRVSCVVVARPTKSAGLYVQMVGRAMRIDLADPVNGRRKALILDVVGASRQHELRSLVDLSMAVTKVKDDQSLLEAEEAEAEARERGETEYYRGPVEVKEFDPLARKSRYVWITTANGNRCLTAGTEEFVLLVPGTEPDMYQVAWCNKSPYQAGRGGFLCDSREFDLEQAMGWAEMEAAQRGGESAATYNRKGRGWRLGSPSPGALGKARQEGVTVDPTWNAGQLSEAIDKALADQRVDQVVAAIVQMRYSEASTQGQRPGDQDKEAA